jgi:hypothetical protein
MRPSNSATRLGLLLVTAATGLALASCNGASASTPGSSAGTPGSSAGVSAVPTSSASEPAGGTTTGDVPDNAVYLTYHGSGPAFSIPYVEGWQVTPKPTGVVIRDKDSSETVAIGGPQADVAGYVSSTDLPALKAQAGFVLIKRDTFAAGSSTYVHLAYHVTSPPDAVTGKQVSLTVDRYYVSGANGLAIVTLATPDGVDNIDAFRKMIEGFKWS